MKDDNDWNYPRTEPHQRFAWGVIALAVLFVFFAWVLAPQ